VDLNQPPKLDEDRKDDVEGEDLDPKFLICDVRANGIKLDVVLKVYFFYKTCCERYTSHMFKEDFGIDEVIINVIILHIKVVQ